jgi:hypothetical protein
MAEEKPPAAPPEELPSVAVIEWDPSHELTKEEKADLGIGRRATEDVAKDFKVVKGSPDLLRLERIVRSLRPVTEKPYQGYELRVVDSKSINAFALPGGYMYFTQGILEAVESDDELAAVAGHEMSHVVLMHSRKQMSRDDKYKRILGSILVASILSNSEGIDPGAIGTMASLVAQDALNHYGREAELEADHEAVLYLNADKQYNPVAVLTVVEGLARMEGSEATPEMGVFQTHPYGKERVDAVAAQLTDLGIPLERRRVIRSLVAESAIADKDGTPIGELRLNGRVVFQPAVEIDGTSPADRAKQAADTMNDLLLRNLQLLEVATAQQGESVQVRARGETLFTVTPDDAAFHKTGVPDLVKSAMTAIQLGFSEEKVRRAY